MIAGSATEVGSPAIRLDVAEQLWTAIIDTGFNGE